MEGRTTFERPRNVYSGEASTVTAASNVNENRTRRLAMVASIEVPGHSAFSATVAAATVCPGVIVVKLLLVHLLTLVYHSRAMLSRAQEARIRQMDRRAFLGSMAGL
jgi:hypothetical protein